MTDEKTIEGCVAPAGGPVRPTPRPDADPGNITNEEESSMHVTVGKPAPDFEAAAYHAGGFKNVKLSDFKGKWVFLCFYPGDFTFV